MGFEVGPHEKKNGLKEGYGVRGGQSKKRRDHRGR